MDKLGSCFLLAKCLKNTCGRVIYMCSADTDTSLALHQKDGKKRIYHFKLKLQNNTIMGSL